MLGLHYGSKKIPCIYFSLLTLQVTGFLSIIAEIFLRMKLIDCIVTLEENKEGVIWYILGIFASVLARCVIEILGKAMKLKITRKYSLAFVEMIGEKCSKLTLDKIESSSIQKTVQKSEDFFQKSMDFTKACGEFISFIVLSVVFFFGFKNISLYFRILFIVLISGTFILNLKEAKSSFGFWRRYMDAARWYNYWSDVQTKKEYAYERRMYQTLDVVNKRFEDAFDQAAKENKRNGMIRFKGQALVEGFGIGITIFSLFYFAVSGGLPVSVYAAVTEMVTRLLAAVSVCVDALFTIHEFQGLYCEMKKLLREPEQYDNKKTIRGKKELEGLITLRNVSFRYNSGSKYALWDFSYSFLKGLHYGVVGVNGSGKTTLIKILLGLYMPDHGYIVSNVEDFNVLFQDFQKYPITVREYVIMGNDTAITDIQIWQILKKLDIGYLKDGLDTVLMLETDNGTGLSGGQYQKLAIARAFLSKAELIILDEPTSSLDPISEKEIYLKCREVFAGRTTLFISHRLGAVRHMDKILVLNYGKLCEEGTHFSLMKKNGIYKKMYETQKGLYIDERECM